MNVHEQYSNFTNSDVRPPKPFASSRTCTKYRHHTAACDPLPLNAGAVGLRKCRQRNHGRKTHADAESHFAAAAAAFRFPLFLARALVLGIAETEATAAVTPAAKA